MRHQLLRHGLVIGLGTLVSVSNGVPLVAERATYWPLNTGGQFGAQSLLAPMTATGSADEAGAPSGPVVQTFDPYAPASAHGAGPRLYERLVGYSRTIGTSPASLDSGPDTGPPETGAEAAAVAAGLLPSTSLATTTTITVTWYGAHLTGGRRQ